MYEHSKLSFPASFSSIFTDLTSIYTIAKLGLNPGLIYIHPNSQRFM